MIQNNIIYAKFKENKIKWNIKDNFSWINKKSKDKKNAIRGLK